MKVIRSAFSVGERVAPQVAGRIAFELFRRTASERSLTAREQDAINRAKNFMDEARHHALTSRFGCVRVHDFRPRGLSESNGTVLVLHGWRSRTEYMQALIMGMRDAGYRVLSLDLPGHGTSSGRRLDLVRAVDAVSLANQWFGPFDAIVGHSFGGAVAVNACVGSIAGLPAVDATRLILIASPESMPEQFDQFGRLLNIGPRSQAVIASRVEKIAGRPLSEFTGALQLATLPIPTLVIHSRDDREVTSSNAERYATAGQHVELALLDGLGHRRILNDPAVVVRTVGFIQSQRPAGATH